MRSAVHRTALRVARTTSAASSCAARAAPPRATSPRAASPRVASGLTPSPCAASVLALSARAYSATQAPPPDASGPSSDAALDAQWEEHSFLSVAHGTLESISEGISELVYAPSSPIPAGDVELSQGVLTISLESHGSYVLNTQTPNRQIWLSSPQSGPARYAWHPQAAEWLSTRDGHSLYERLTSELSGILGQAVKFEPIKA